MYSCTVQQLREICGLAAVDDSLSRAIVHGVSIDSRAVQPGDVFFALPGTRTHGVRFASDALKAGAVCVVSCQPAGHLPFLAGAVSNTEREQSSSRILLVPDSQRALQRLAVWNRRQSEALMIGVTGSVGKTTTRQMIASVLSAGFRGLQSPQNYNNEIGLPLTLCQLNAQHEFASLELGAGKQGDISFLCGMAHPEMAVVTRVAPCHIETFGSMEQIRRTKQELVESVDEQGTVFLNADDPLVRSMEGAASGRVVWFGVSNEADFRAKDIVCCDGETEFRCLGSRYRFQGPRHLVTSALAAIAVGTTVGLTVQRMADGLKQFRPDPGRGQIRMTAPWVVIDESYNASPASVLAAIESLHSWKKRRRILVLGDMLELGDSAAALHGEVARSLVKAEIDHTLFCGKFADEFASSALASGLPLNRISAFHDQATLMPMLECVLSPGDVVCVKGSRSTHMEEVIRLLIQRASDFQRSAA